MKFIKTWLANLRKKQLAKAPKTLLQAVEALDKSATDEDRVKFAKEDGNSPGANLHFCGGMAMRNEWGLWDKEKPLTKWFREYGVWHADDMSSIIYKSYWRFLNGKEFNMVKESIECEKYWKRQGLGFDGIKLNGKN